MKMMICVLMLLAGCSGSDWKEREDTFIQGMGFSPPMHGYLNNDAHGSWYKWEIINGHSYCTGIYRNSQEGFQFLVWKDNLLQWSITDWSLWTCVHKWHTRLAEFSREEIVRKYEIRTGK